MTFPGLDLSFTHAVFESASGFTTTGGTVIDGLIATSQYTFLSSAN